MKSVLSPNQEDILHSLLPIAELALNNDLTEGQLKPRLNSLICAPSGTGKSHIMKELGARTDAPVLFLNVSSWQPLGGRGDGEKSLETLVRFVDENPKGIIILDELDKLNSQDPWSGYIRLEIHDILDGEIPKGVKIKEEGEDEDEW